MPELPEVETIRRQLKNAVVGQKVMGVEVREPKSYLGGEVKGREILDINRVGKYLYIEFSAGVEWEIHLKMTGRLVYSTQATRHGTQLDYETAKHTRVVVTLTKGKLYFWDSRKFGYIRTVGKRVELGKEPWEITEEQFYTLCQKSGRAIKNLILDQKILSGVGNIYANDALWEAEVDPRRTARSLTQREADNLLHKMRMVMERGLSTGGASDNSYVDALGQRGRYQDEFRVYRRTGEPCRRCGTKLVRVVVGGRGSWVCRKCQS